MDARTLDTLELKALIELAARHVQTQPGGARMRSLRPMTDRSDVMRELELTSECVSFLNTRGRFGLGGIDDPEPIVAKLHIEGTSLEPREILSVERLLLVGKELKELVRSADQTGSFPHLSRIASQIPDLKSLMAEIHGKILPNGEIDDNASPELRDVRKELTERRHRIHRTLESILRGSEQAVQEEIITFRNGRFVIPVRTDSRNQIPGVVHGLSSSGQTTFVEPMTIINQNNDLVRLREQEEIEVTRILFSIAESLRRNVVAIRTTLDTVAIVDVAQAKAVFAEEFRCTPPRITEGKRLDLVDARHILLEHSLRASGGTAVPISLELDDDNHVLVISGPNAGGKTVVLKTLGLACLMAQMGFHVPARDAHLPVLAQIFADIGDQQSIAANLSTFTAHMRNIAETAEQVRPPALVLLDEVGTGTDPDEGAALAISIIDYFRRKGAITAASTHYPRLKMWASQTAGVKNASVEFDERTLRPTYRLMLGMAGASSGIEIARRMNVPEDILQAAHELVEPSHAEARDYLRRLKESMDEQEAIRTALAEERAAVSEKYAGLELTFAQREDVRRKEFEAALAGVVDEFKSESERALKKVKDKIEASRIRKTAENQAAELRGRSARLRRGLDPEQAAATLAAENQVIAEGDHVRIRSFGHVGTVESIREGTYVVTVGALRYRADRSDLERVGGAAAPTSAPRPQTVAQDEEPAESELKVIGMTADEAVERVDKFLDQAFLAGVNNIRIIHGHGKGILRKAIADFLTGHPQVAKFALATPDKGGGGATLVQLKE